MSRLLLALWLLAAPLAVAGAPSEELAALLDEVWRTRLRESPLTATRVGVYDANDRLDAVSLADEDRRAAQQAGFLQRLRAIDRDALSRDERLEHDLLQRNLAEAAVEHAFGEHLMPLTGRAGFHISFPELPDNTPLNTLADYEAYLSRLRAFPEYTAGHLELLREGLRRGLTRPAIIFEGYSETVDAHVVNDPEVSLLYKPFREFPAGVPETQHGRLRDEARAAIREAVVPAYRRLGAFLKDEYFPGCQAVVGSSALPGGREYYRHCVRKYTTLDVTPDEVHQTGLAEVRRIRGEMLALIDRVGFQTERGDKFAAFVEHLRNAPEFYAETDDELLAHTSAILKRADGQLPKLFGRLPRMPYGLKPVPDYIAPKTTMAYYQRPAGDGTRAGFYFLNTYNLPSRPKYMMQALALHEAVPGHHLQIALQQELEGLSPLRKYSGFTAFVEGWALYAERLGQEIGFYEDPYADFGRLTMEVWRASRLVVDTGLHYKGWTRDRAIEFLSENSAMSLHNIRAEVDRYLGWPGQALAYKMGELKIRELRARAEDRLGARFDVRAFHDTVLGSGAVPLTVLEQIIDEWIAEQAAD